jgi:hypothetical protein
MLEFNKKEKENEVKKNEAEVVETKQAEEEEDWE